ncbi:MAG: hypothetical protein Q4C47_09345 [Planctomycetia bacterium]|nr:hypothetical protein [Planctomycetia bacterium]
MTVVRTILVIAREVLTRNRPILRRTGASRGSSLTNRWWKEIGTIAIPAKKSGKSGMSHREPGGDS